MSNDIIGKQFIGGKRIANGSAELKSLNAETGEVCVTRFHEATREEIAQAAEAAADAYLGYRQTSLSQRAAFLEAIADEIDALGDDFIQEVARETALPNARLLGERARTTGQLRLFAEVVRRGDFLGARIDNAIPDRTPLPKVDIRQAKIGMGPVAVFGASNFPLAFSVAGGDTASALAAGCPVVVKAHSAHLMTTEFIASAIERAVLSTDMPAGTFNLIYGDLVGKDLVLHPAIKAVGFTGSINGGRALFDLAASRPEPIPVFAEMSSINPVILCEGSLATRAKDMAKESAASITNNCGQLCTKPGLFIGVKSEAFFSFKVNLIEQIKTTPPQVMLNQRMLNFYNKGIERLNQIESVTLVAQSDKEDKKASSYLFSTSAESLLSEESQLEEEIFGPASVLVELDNKSQLVEFLNKMQGQLTFTLQATEQDLEENKDILILAEHKVGRILLNGYPTGVEVCDSMVHGGPYPATTDARGTSVGTLAIDRFLRPVCYQNYPDALLPEELKNSNPLKITRLVNGELSNKSIV